MAQKKAPPQTAALLVTAFGNYTRSHVVQVLRQVSGNDDDTSVLIAATALASNEPHGTHPGQELLITAFDILTNSRRSLAKELLWQAATSAANSRIRIEAIRRAGKAANLPDRRQLIRKWSAEGFHPQVNFQSEQLTSESVREAAVTALGNLSNPDDDDIDAVLRALTPPPEQGKFSPALFRAATEAYWKVGSFASFPKIIPLLSGRSRDDIALPLIGLSAKFTAQELKGHAEALTKALLDHAQTWPDDPITRTRLGDLAKKLATPPFLLNWVSRFGGEGLTHGRGQITSILLQAFHNTPKDTTEALLVLAQSLGNVGIDGPVVQGLRLCAHVGHGQPIAERTAAQQHPGHNALLESGYIFTVFSSIKQAVNAFAEALSARPSPHEQRPASRVALGVIVSASRAVAAEKHDVLDYPLLSSRGVQSDRSEAQRTHLSRGLAAITVLKDDDNPLVLVARLVMAPRSLPGAAAIAETWLQVDDDLGRYAMRTIAREAGRTGVASPSSNLMRIEQYLLRPQGQRPALRALLQQSLSAEILVEGRLNRYALDAMQRERLGFEQGADLALAGLHRADDADFLLDRLADSDMGNLSILMKAVSFHREGSEDLTARVQGRAISSAADVLVRNSDPKSIERFGLQLHDRFQDMPAVREAAYKACGRLGSFVSIKPLRNRLSNEPLAKAKAHIDDALALLRTKLVDAKPGQGPAEDIKLWLGYVADLGDPEMLPRITGYLRPPHADHSVRHAALLAVQSMGGPTALEVIKQFIEDTAPEGQTLAIARRALLSLEERSDVELFDVLGQYFPPDASVLDPAVKYDEIFDASAGIAVTRGLKNADRLWENGHWDEFVTKINGAVEAAIRKLFRVRYSDMKLDQQLAERLAGNAYANMLNTTQFKTTYGKLQAHANTIMTYRRESSTAHATNRDGTEKDEATRDDAVIVRREFQSAFTEVVRILR